VRSLADGLVMWGGGPSWDPSFAWWTQLQEFLGESPAPLAAPSNLSIEQSGATLRWTDNAGNESGYVIERSSDGTNFTNAGTVGPDVTSWSDSRINGGATYTYRVRAFNGFDSSVWITATATMRRAAGLLTQAETYETGAGVVRSSTSVSGLDSGDYLVYRAVDFGAGLAPPDQFLASLAVDPTYARQRIEIRLDAPDGRLLGTLTTSATAAWWRFAPMSASLLPASGVHDLYLVGRGRLDGTLNEGVAVIDWFKLNRAAPPAPPSNLVANSPGGRIDLRWQDNSGDETVMFIERSADGGATYQAVGALPANTTTYTDVPPQPGVVYKYRVRAGNASGQSGPSLSDAGIPGTQNPYTVMHALDAHSSSGPIFPTPWTVGVPPGSHVSFLGADFGTSGATVVAMRFAAPFNSQGARVEVRLDDPSGPLVATVLVQAGGSYGAFEVAYAAVTGAVGVHDICIVPVDPNSGVNLDWVMFLP
jgi:hypothetical protein